MQGTRQEILNILRAEKQATVEDLAQRLELTPMTIRHHLNVLQAQNLVEASKVRRSKQVGRPRLVYTLTDAADDLFPHGYDDLARYLLTEVKGMISEEETEAIFHRVAERVASEAPPPMENQSFEERIEQVSGFLEDRGFLSRWEQTDEGYVLTNVNCPYRQVSEEHHEVCVMDTALLGNLFGVEPKRLSSMRQGDDACRFLLVPDEEGME
ncbi:MAG: ArsR family transcriptional regulator [Anaerolineae bacterium]|jgi:predicted ArsR family transcriptional regulator